MRRPVPAVDECSRERYPVRRCVDKEHSFRPFVTVFYALRANNARRQLRFQCSSWTRDLISSRDRINPKWEPTPQSFAPLHTPPTEHNAERPVRTCMDLHRISMLTKNSHRVPNARVRWRPWNFSLGKESTHRSVFIFKIASASSLDSVWIFLLATEYLKMNKLETIFNNLIRFSYVNTMEV